MPVEILIDENDTINAIVTVGSVSVEFIAGVSRKGDTIHLDGLHLERLSEESMSRSEIELLGAELCRYWSVKKLTVQGARRTTGRSPGSIPRLVEFEARD